MEFRGKIVRTLRGPRRWAKVLIAVLAATAITASASAQSVRSAGRSFVATRWQLDFTFHDPERITVQSPGCAAPETYWYMLYRVTNNTGADVQFYPSFRLVTDTLTVVDGGDGVGTHVYEAIARRHEKDVPFFAMPTKVSGLLLQGEENARTSAVVFRNFDPDANGFTIFVSGLSGVVDRIPNPKFDTTHDESPENPRFFVLRQTLALHYDLPGDLSSRIEAKPVRRNREWVMR